MKPKQGINEKWIKASIIGTTWAASEIVLGSFFHNLRIPFSSNILTGIGIILLVSASYKWKENGLFWRAGLICALMKTMSPSAVIFGPMIAIFSESLLLEASARLFGKTMAGYLLGGMLAMSWNLFHKIMNFIIFYGFNIVEIYSDLLKFAQKQLHISFDIVWLPILFLLMIYCAMGFIAALIGIRVGRKLTSQPVEKLPVPFVDSKPDQTGSGKSFDYSVIWLVSDIFLLIGGLVLISVTPWYIWCASTSIIALVWVSRYKRALRQLSRPRFWLFFAGITMITVFVLNRVQSQEFIYGILVGIQMNCRAVIVILGFSVLGTELYNPVIRSFFLRTSFRQLPLALELSFESLPAMISAIPEYKTFIKSPVSVICRIMSQIDFRLLEIREKLAKKIIIISGTIGEGKTTQIRKLVEEFKAQGIPVAGIVSPRVMSQSETTGYDIIDIATDDREQFLRVTTHQELDKVGRYSILPEGMKTGKDALKQLRSKNYKFVVVDEVGRLELDNEGWAPDINDLVDHSASNLIFAVRDIFTEQVIRKWNFQNYRIFPVSESQHRDILAYLES